VPASPWKSFAQVDRDRELLILATYLPLNRFASTLRFARLVGVIRKQLADTSGLFGYSMLAKPLSKQYWTVSIWESEAALQAFVRKNPHREVMAALAGHMGATRFVRWTALGSERRPSWGEAISRLR
jgi:heme-degrading monooxygenase HmoA